MYVNTSAVYQYCEFFTSGFFDHLPKNFVTKSAPLLSKLAKRVKESDLYLKYGTPE